MCADNFQLFIDFFIDELNNATIGLNEDLHRLWDIARKHAKKTYDLAFCSKVNRQLVKNNLKPIGGVDYG